MELQPFQANHSGLPALLATLDGCVEPSFSAAVYPRALYVEQPELKRAVSFVPSSGSSQRHLVVPLWGAEFKWASFFP